MSDQIMKEQGLSAPPSAQQIEEYFNGHGIDSQGRILHGELGQLPGDQAPATSNGWFVCFAIILALIYYIRRKKTFDDEEDSLFVKQNTQRNSWKRFFKDPFNRRKDNNGDDFDAIF